MYWQGRRNIIVIHTSPLRLKNKSVVKRLPPKQKVIKNLFFDSEISAIAPRIGADKKTTKAVVPERKCPHGGSVCRYINAAKFKIPPC